MNKENTILLNLFDNYILSKKDENFFSDISIRFLDFADTLSTSRKIKLVIAYFRFITKNFEVIKAYPRFRRSNWFSVAINKAKTFQKHVSNIEDKKVFRKFLLVAKNM